MLRRILENRLKASKKSILLLGPRQVGKSTLCRQVSPNLTIDLADEAEFQRYAKDPDRLRRELSALSGKPKTLLIDEIQRLPSLLNTIQALVDRDKSLRFLLTGSSARKLKRGQANLLPGRLLVEHLPPLAYWEITDRFDLERCLTMGTLPEVYLDQNEGPAILASYATTYLREEIQAEALTKDLGAYGRFLDLAAELSGQYVNYSKIASDSEINKETIRRYFAILSDTLLVETIPSFTEVDAKRKARQRERFIFFDMGVRNAILGRHKFPPSREERGSLLEQWVILQCLYYARLFQKPWKISSYRDDQETEVDLLLDTGTQLIAIEIKSTTHVDEKMLRSARRFATLTKRKVDIVLVFLGERPERFDDGSLALPLTQFLGAYLAAL